MNRVTLDTNCLIDLEVRRDNAKYLDPIVEYWQDNKIELQVVAISGSEKTKDIKRPESFNLFKNLLSSLGLDGVNILKPMGYISISYIGWAIISNDAMLHKEEEIHNILFPNIAFKRADYCASDLNDPKYQKWLNAKCDVQALWSHIHHGGDIFITSDTNYHKTTKKTVLENMGVGIIANPKEALGILKNKI